MPRPLHGGFLTLLYALGTAANTEGRLRFRDGKAIRIQDIARAVGSSEKDTRRYINAAIAARVVGYEKPPKRGRATVYRLIVEAYPMWDLAAESLLLSRPNRKDAAPPPWREDQEQASTGAPESSGVGDPNRDDEEFGSPTPEVTDGTGQRSSGHRDTLEFGSPTPQQFGSPTPEQPRVPQGFPTVGADVVGQPQVDDGWELQEPPPEDEEPPPTERLDEIAGRVPETDQEHEAPQLQALAGGAPPDADTRAGQRALLLAVAGPHAATPAELAELRAAGEADPARVLEALASLGIQRTYRLYGWRLTTEAINARSRTGT